MISNKNKYENILSKLNTINYSNKYMNIAVIPAKEVKVSNLKIENFSIILQPL